MLSFCHQCFPFARSLVNPGTASVRNHPQGLEGVAPEARHTQSPCYLGSPVTFIFQLLLPNYGLLVGKVAGKSGYLGIQVGCFKRPCVPYLGNGLLRVTKGHPRNRNRCHVSGLRTQRVPKVKRARPAKEARVKTRLHFVPSLKKTCRRTCMGLYVRPSFMGHCFPINATPTVRSA